MHGVVAPVREQPAEGSGGLDQGLGHADVVDVAGAEQEHVGTAPFVDQTVDLGRPAATRAAYALEEGPPLAPAAERWALTEVLSMAALE